MRSTIIGSVLTATLLAACGPSASPAPDPTPTVSPRVTSPAGSPFASAPAAGQGSPSGSAAPAGSLDPGGSVMPVGSAAPAGSAGTGGSGGLVEGLQWVLVQYADGEAMPTLPPRVLATLTLSGGQASGTGGCNTFSGPYTLAGPSLAFGELATTDRRCSGADAQAEPFYLAMLAEVASFTATNADLSLFDAPGRVVLRFLRNAAATVLGSWRIDTYATDLGSQVRPAVATVPAVTFLADGTVTGSTGCNDLGGTHLLNGPLLTVEVAALTTNACSETLATQEQLILQGFERTTRWTSATGGVELADDGGRTQLTLAP